MLWTKGLCTTTTTLVMMMMMMMGLGPAMAESESQALKTVARSNTAFSSSLYNVLTQAVEGNLIFSPYSLSAVMAMVKLGAQGKTANDVQKAMQFPESDETLVKGYKALLETLKGTDEFTLETVNKIYAASGFGIKANYSSQLQQNFGAKIDQLDFTKGAVAANTINGFVSSVTRNKIKDLVSAGDFDGMTRLVLINAIYFKGLWKNQFKKELTKEGDFHVSKDQTVKVPMMKVEAEFPFAEIEELDARAIALPYKGDKLSMIILLPNEIDGLKDMEKKLPNFNLQNIPARLRERKIQLSMPKFTLESTIDLKGPLTALGAGSIFDMGVADFSNIPERKEDLYVSKAVQKAFIEVNEEGSEAAAATAFQITARSGLDFSEFFSISHPFLALISHQDVDTTLPPYQRRSEDIPITILFHTTVANPTIPRMEVKSSFWIADSGTGLLPSVTFIVTCVLGALYTLNIV